MHVSRDVRGVLPQEEIATRKPGAKQFIANETILYATLKESQGD
jgi:hypothetical protein